MACLPRPTDCVVRRAAINATTNGNNTIVAADATRKIRVLALSMLAAGTVGIAFEDGAGGDELTGQFPMTAGSPVTLPYNPLGWFEGSSNTLLNLETDADVDVFGCIVYELVV